MNPDTQGMANKINVSVSLVLRTFLASALNPVGYNHAQTKVFVRPQTNPTAKHHNAHSFTAYYC
jgi:hypothetical protein